ncbi:hypothetical protein [Streptomyces sp. NPDC006925]|uniref:hypothetical protein n=1 Tax=Streptomyces sp. NPDC006925 TaxID=3364768 RepID=UPI0036A073D0
MLPRYRIAVFVDGCFWHGCPEHCPAEFQGPNSLLWQEKITANRKRDQRNTMEAREAPVGPWCGSGNARSAVTPRAPLSEWRPRPVNRAAASARVTL